MPILKLKDEGDEATLTITGCEEVEGEYGMQVKFDADNGDTLYVPQSSVDRQMDRIGVAEYAEIVGQTIHFYRAPNKKAGGKPYWNIDKAGVNDVKTPPSNGKPPVAQASPDLEEGAVTGFALLISRYDECVDAANKAWGGDMSSEALVAAAATLFIARNQKGV